MHQLVAIHGLQSLWRGAGPMLAVVPLQNGLLMAGTERDVWKQRAIQTARNAVVAKPNWRPFLSEAAPEVQNESEHCVHCHSLSLSPIMPKRVLPQIHKPLTRALLHTHLMPGVLQSFLMSPVELIKVSLQCWTTGSASTAQNVAMRQWYPLLTWGLTATLLRDGIPHGVWFVTYNVCKTSLCPELATTTTDDNAASTMTAVPVLVSLGSGAVAATVAWLVGYPVDLIKTRIQAQTLSVSLGIVGTARLLIVEAHGSVLAGLYRGLGLKLVRAIPSSMIGFTVYEHVKDWLWTI
jgi:Mitochondrial carrier protein